MRISVNIITQNRVNSLSRLLNSLTKAYYLGDEVPITFNMDSRVDEATIKLVNSFNWPHGPKILRRRIIQGGLIRAVSESCLPPGALLHLALHPTIGRGRERTAEMERDGVLQKGSPEHAVPPPAAVQLGSRLLPQAMERVLRLHESEVYGGREDEPGSDPEIEDQRLAGVVEEVPDRHDVPSWVREFVPEFSGQRSFSTNHMEPGAHIAAKENVVRHDKSDFEVPLVEEDFLGWLPGGKLPPASKLPSLNLFNQAVSLKGLKAAGAKLGMDVLECNSSESVVVDHGTGLPFRCARF
ncbi:hypothetical protein U1Q18_049332 [Sarracenia purpurea var. burkii]